MGWFGLVLPEADGGSGLSAVEHALFHREVGRQCGPIDVLAQGLAAMVTDDPGVRGGTRAVVLAVGGGSTLRLLGAGDATLALHVDGDSAQLLDVSTSDTGTRPSLDPATGMRTIVRGAPTLVALRRNANIRRLGQQGWPHAGRPSRRTRSR
jgi:hypothetical protein